MNITTSVILKKISQNAKICTSKQVDENLSKITTYFSHVELQNDFVIEGNKLIFDELPLMRDLVTFCFEKSKLKENADYCFIIPENNNLSRGDFNSYIGGYGVLRYFEMPFLIHAHKVVSDNSEKNIYNITIELLFY